MVVLLLLETGEFRGQKQKRIPFLKNEAEKLLIINNPPEKTNPNKPKNKAGKLLKTRSSGKNKAKNKAEHLADNKGSLKNKPKTNRGKSHL